VQGVIRQEPKGVVKMALDPSSRLKEKIVKYLQDRYRKTGVNSPVSWRTIWIEMPVTEEDFSKALQAAKDYIVFVDNDQIKLSRRGLPLSQSRAAWWSWTRWWRWTR
jgi:hypothetical protein